MRLKLCTLLCMHYALIHSTETTRCGFSEGQSRGKNVLGGNSHKDTPKKKEQMPFNTIQQESSWWHISSLCVF